MVTRHTRGKVTWVDLESPSHQELDEVLREFKIDDRIEEEIIAPTPYPITISFPAYRYLILHFPTTDPGNGTRNQEVDFIVGKKFIITARYEIIDSIHNLHRVFEAEELLGLLHPTTRADELLERLLRRLYGAIREEVEHSARLIERIEHDIFTRHERDTVHAISDAGRILQHFQTTLARHEEPLGAFLEGLASPSFFGKQFADHSRHIMGEREHVADLVRAYRAAAIELRATNDSLLNATQNEIVKRLTVIAFFVSPLTLLAALFSLSVHNLPLVDDPNAFWIIIFMGLAISVAAFVFFKLKRWI